MSKKEKISLREQQAINAKKKHETSVKYMYFSRYLMVRYSVTIMLFANLFWLVFCLPYHEIAMLGLIVAGIMTIYAAAAAIEQLTKIHNRTPDIPITRIYLWAQLGLNVVLAVLELTPLGQNVFPFVTTSSSKWLMEVFLLAGILICIFCEMRIRNINQGKDRYRKVINVFEKNRQ